MRTHEKVLVGVLVAILIMSMVGCIRVAVGG